MKDYVRHLTNTPFIMLLATSAASKNPDSADMMAVSNG